MLVLASAWPTETQKKSLEEEQLAGMSGRAGVSWRSWTLTGEEAVVVPPVPRSLCACVQRGPASGSPLVNSCLVPFRKSYRRTALGETLWLSARHGTSCVVTCGSFLNPCRHGEGTQGKVHPCPMRGGDLRPSLSAGDCGGQL